jgi:predicted helicase
MDHLNVYLAELNLQHRQEKALEYSCRSALRTLIQGMTGLTVNREPLSGVCGVPEYIVTRNGVPVGYVKIKDRCGAICSDGETCTQLDRCKHALGNLIITDYLTFQLWNYGKLAETVQVSDTGIIAGDDLFIHRFNSLFNRFGNATMRTIEDTKTLARILAGKAHLLADVIGGAADDPTMEKMEKMVPPEHIDMYAQTLTYGAFAACLEECGAGAFTRQTLARFVPATDPFVQQFFNTALETDTDNPFRWILDDLIALLNTVDTGKVLRNFERAGQDALIHFYERFLTAYNPAMRKSHGVFYTPQAIVRFIVQAADAVLKTRFHLQSGIADTSKAGTVHKVHVLDPACGTGTFLAEVIDTLYRDFKGGSEWWERVCQEHIPRLHGFELLMAPYTMAHFNVGLHLKRTGYYVRGGDRLNIYLTDSLERTSQHKCSVALTDLSEEPESARRIGPAVPVMVVLGNPPYNRHSQNKGEWIQDLLADYKVGLNEQKFNLDDDYIKFIRLGQHLIDKKGSGILAYINNNSFIDGVTHRQMRHSLLQSFDLIYILDLHGSSRKKETMPNGDRDENVFKIIQGVSINVFIRTGEKQAMAPATVLHYDLYGTRKAKLQFLSENDLQSISWKELKPEYPYYFFVPKDFSLQKEYETGFKVSDLFPVYKSGMKTDRDSLFIDNDRNCLARRIQKLLSGAFDDNFINQFNIRDSSSYKLTNVIKNKVFSPDNIRRVQYRLFDYRYVYYQPGIISRPAYTVMRHFLPGENTGLILCRIVTSNNFHHCFVHNRLIESGTLSNKPSEFSYSFPLYLYPESGAARTPNLNPEIANNISNIAGACTPENVQDYIYAVLHSPRYRSTYKEFLKIDFPRIPYPESAQHFYRLADFGEKLRKLHLLDGIEPDQEEALYPVNGSNAVEKPEYRTGAVWINKDQYFAPVPAAVWDFYIGGCQPAQKWLKGRCGQILSSEDVRHYQKIVSALAGTIDIQAQI